jgi:NTP pyrophosphatase (non-canonical NTP hydrolase)
VKHFQWNDEPRPTGISCELADVSLYLLQISSIADIDLEQAILNKLQKNYSRNWDENS